MAAKIKVAIFGASGRSGSSIVEGLLESPETFEITVFARPSSLTKPQNLAYARRGIPVLPCAIADGPPPALTAALRGFDVVISALGPAALPAQMPLAAAAKAAGVARFVPSAFGACAPPARGVVDVCDGKEEVLGFVADLRLACTVVDVGCWYESALPELPSGRTDGARVAVGVGGNVVPGRGRVRSAMTAWRDVGRWVARAVADPRTLNERVFAYGEVLTADEACEVVERISGEGLGRNYISEEQLRTTIAEARGAVRTGKADVLTGHRLHLAQCAYSSGVRGDNTPEAAKSLGYLDARELYPDFKPFSFEDFVRHSLRGRVSTAFNKSPAWPSWLSPGPVHVVQQIPSPAPSC